MAIIQLEDVSFRYAAQPTGEMALRDVSYSIAEGRFVGITGESAAGKATFCRLVAGHIPHFYQGDLTGSVTVDGAPTTDRTLGDLASTVGFVFENPYDQLTGATSTVLEEVAFGLESMGLSREEMRERALDTLDLVGIEELADRHPQRLSGGQCQRVAIASVLAMRPEILILQQPTAQLDPEGTEDVIRVVTEMNREGFTVVMVSQNLDRLVPHVDELLVFDDGRIQLEGAPRDVLTAAVERSLPIPVPTPVRVGHRLREAGYVDRSEPMPITLAACAEELKPLVAATSGRQPVVTDSASSFDRSGVVEPDGSTAAASDTGDAGDPRDELTASGDDLASARTDRVVFDDLCHTYPGGVRALQNVSFEMDEGCVCIIGQNGAGKSTLVKHLNGLLKPTEGSVFVEGTDTSEKRVAQLAHDVGLSFQNPDDQLFHDTVESEVRYGPRNLGYDDATIDELVERALSQFDLENSKERNPYDLVISWRKRVAVASVAAMDTPVVVLDEPTSGQDAPGQAILGEFVTALGEEGKLVVVITHDMDFVRRYADRVVVLSQANLLLDGDPRAVLSAETTLRKADVQPPAITRLGKLVGLSEPLLSVDELLASIEREQN
ncbi:ABC transporter ATP-binding protein [Halegenticoccus tardaugens]|uniref:ABC transporter ATP-binding protein n=1 Tax=Halegenticoccus tardaugens TaxID=2071624 RepID=UPI00100AEAD7|nr:ABC transporter ATP-binding protein [Halegenticoccus tardaugens]